MSRLGRVFQITPDGGQVIAANGDKFQLPGASDFTVNDWVRFDIQYGSTGERIAVDAKIVNFDGWTLAPPQATEGR